VAPVNFLSCRCHRKTSKLVLPEGPPRFLHAPPPSKATPGKQAIGVCRSARRAKAVRDLHRACRAASLRTEPIYETASSDPQPENPRSSVTA
jgi:hypothetical protein